MHGNRRSFFALLIILNLTGPWLPRAYSATAMIIDTFDTTAQVALNGEINTTVAPEAIGGYRTITMNGLGAKAIVSTALGWFTHNSLGQHAATSSITWDNAGAGLGGIDLTGGLADGYFEVGITSLDNVPMVFTFSVNGTTHSVTVNSPGASTLQVPFSHFTGVDFTRIDAIELTMQGVPAADMGIDFVRTGGVVPVIDLELNKSISPSGPYQVGDSVTFTITVFNRGPHDATGVKVEDRLPPGYGQIGNISHGGRLTGHTIAWSGLTIPANTQLALTFDAILLAHGGYTNTAEIIAADQNDNDSVPNDQTGDDIATLSINPPLPSALDPQDVPSLSTWTLPLLGLLLMLIARIRHKHQE